MGNSPAPTEAVISKSNRPEQIFVPEKIHGIIGNPLGHTLSPAVHNFGFQTLGLKMTYHKWEIANDDLEDFIRGVRVLPISGVSVTIPFKEKVIPMMDETTDLAKKVGAVNTLYWDDGKLMGDNTDVAGFLAPVRNTGIKPKTALVLGAGGACRAVLAGLNELDLEKKGICNRTASKAQILGDEFGADFVEWDERTENDWDLVINTTPLGMTGKFVDSNPWPEDSYHKLKIAYDIVYSPLETNFLRLAREKGAKTINGLEMFIFQALRQFEIWTGKNLDPDELRKYLLTLLAK